MPKASLRTSGRAAAVSGRRAFALLPSLIAALVLLPGAPCGPVGEGKLKPTSHSPSVADDRGALLEQQVGSRIEITGVRFPSRPSEMDIASFEFETTDSKGLLFHADSDDDRHAITAWVDNGAVKVGLSGWCLWLKLSEVLWDDVNVSDGRVHKFTIQSRRSGGIRFRVDDRDELAFLHIAVFSCWHVDNFYFGSPGEPKHFYAENNSDSEYPYKMTSCVKNFVVNSTTTTSANPKFTTSANPKFSYYRVSSCPRKGGAAETPRRQMRPLHSVLSPQQPKRHPRSHNIIASTHRPAAFGGSL